MQWVDYNIRKIHKWNLPEADAEKILRRQRHEAIANRTTLNDQT